MTTRGISWITPVSAMIAAAALVACGGSNSASSDAGGEGDALADGSVRDGGGGPDAASQDASLGDASGGDGGADGGADDAAHDGGFVMAPHAALPRVIHWGPPTQGVLKAPKIVTVTFAGDPFQAQAEALGKGFASSSFWKEVLPEFCDSKSGPCVGDGPPGVAVHLGAEPATDAGQFTMGSFPTWLTEQLTSGALPAPDSASPSETMYVVYFQQGFKFAGLCSGFLGYHGVAKYGSPAQLVTYAVVGECKQGAGMTSLELTTQTANHEIVEATTDPHNGFYLDLNDPATFPWNNLLGGEVGDLCDWYGPSPDFVYWPGENVSYPTSAGTLSLQRIWSPKAAAAGKDPCLPVPSGVVFFGVAPSQPVVVLDVGGSATIDATAFSVAPMGSFNVEVGAQSKYVTVSLSGVPTADGGASAIVSNGDKLKIDVHLVKDPGSLFATNGTVVIHTWTGTPAAPTAAYEWPFMVATPADAKDGGIDSGITMRPEEPAPIPRPTPWARPEAIPQE